MKTTNPKISRTQINQNIWSAISAIHIGDLQTLSALVQTRAQANWLWPNQQGSSLLCTAVLYKQVHIVKWLLEMGANPNTVFLGRRRFAFPPVEKYTKGHYKSPLLMAINGDSVEVIALFLEHGASLDLPVFVYTDGISASLFCRQLLPLFGLEEPVKARREAMQIAKAVGATPTQITAGKVRL